MRSIGVFLVVAGAIVGLLLNLFVGALVVLIGIGLVVAGGSSGETQMEYVTDTVGKYTRCQYKCPKCGGNAPVKFVTPPIESFADLNQVITVVGVGKCVECGQEVTGKASFAHPMQRREPMFLHG